MTASIAQHAAAQTESQRLASCERAYEAGDFAQVHALALELSQSPSADTAARARAWLGRVSIDGVALGVLAGALLLFLLTVNAYVF